MSKKKASFGITALYERLSQEDELKGESGSISNQKEYLERYAKQNGFTNLVHYADDGYTGTNFERPAFKEMLSEIEKGNVDTVIVKDMSRFGRNYLQVGFYTEMLFPKKGVRFIAVTNSIDSDKPVENDFTPFINIMNEWYARDTSKKLKAIFQSKMRDGIRVNGRAPYGYYTKPKDKQLYVDPVSAEIVREIFQMTADGKCTREVLDELNSRRILCPGAYAHEYHPLDSSQKVTYNPYEWTRSNIYLILDNDTYLGHLYLGKTTVDYRTKKTVRVPKEEQYFFPNTHEAIISQELWDKAQAERRRVAKRFPKGKITQFDIYNTRLFCADCGSRMVLERYSVKNGEKFLYRCKHSACEHNQCSRHAIYMDTLNEIVLRLLRSLAKRVIQDEKAFAKELKEQYENDLNLPSKKMMASVDTLKKRNESLSIFTKNLYEDRVNGVISEVQFRQLMDMYREEQEKNEKSIGEYEKQLSGKKDKSVAISKFIKLIKQYKNPQEVTEDLIRAVFDRIEIHEKTETETGTEVKLDLFFNFIGPYNVELTDEEKEYYRKQEETAILRKAEEKIQRSRERGRKQYWKEKNARDQARMEKYDGHLFPQKECLTCGELFWPDRVNTAYCCEDCRRLAKNKQERQLRWRKNGGHRIKQRVCFICGNLFWPERMGQNICSEQCLKANEQRKKEKEIKRVEDEKKARRKYDGHLFPQIPCEHCGNLFWPNVANAKFCSTRCLRAAQYQRQKDNSPERQANEGHKNPKRKCEYCGKEFWPYSKTTKFCSAKCRQTMEYQQQKEKNFKWIDDEMHLYPQKECVICGNLFWPRSYNTLYCSEECQIRADILKKQRQRASDPSLVKNDGHKFVPKHCVVCGKVFEPTGTGAKYCSPECKKQAKQLKSTTPSSFPL